MKNKKIFEIPAIEKIDIDQNNVILTSNQTFDPDGIFDKEFDDWYN